MKDIQDLRDSLAHANDYATTRNTAQSLCQCVKAMDSWIQLLAESASGQVRRNSEHL
jgi:hypothetical protein